MGALSRRPALFSGRGHTSQSGLEYSNRSSRVVLPSRLANSLVFAEPGGTPPSGPDGNTCMAGSVATSGQAADLHRYRVTLATSQWPTCAPATGLEPVTVRLTGRRARDSTPRGATGRRASLHVRAGLRCERAPVGLHVAAESVTNRCPTDGWRSAATRHLPARLDM